MCIIVGCVNVCAVCVCVAANEPLPFELSIYLTISLINRLLIGFFYYASSSSIRVFADQSLQLKMLLLIRPAAMAINRMKCARRSIGMYIDVPCCFITQVSNDSKGLYRSEFYTGELARTRTRCLKTENAHWLINENIVAYVR